jgi:hypothetical protein
MLPFRTAADELRGSQREEEDAEKWGDRKGKSLILLRRKGNIDGGRWGGDGVRGGAAKGRLGRRGQSESSSLTIHG